ncbi:hypothetical protein OAS39_02195 [Pirellulales bacterium]|nr:hypothetical protein [Pirellulales bacterium]
MRLTLSVVGFAIGAEINDDLRLAVRTTGVEDRLTGINYEDRYMTASNLPLANATSQTGSNPTVSRSPTKRGNQSETSAESNDDNGVTSAVAASVGPAQTKGIEDDLDDEPREHEATVSAQATNNKSGLTALTDPIDDPLTLLKERDFVSAASAAVEQLLPELSHSQVDEVLKKKHSQDQADQAKTGSRFD